MHSRRVCSINSANTGNVRVQSFMNAPMRPHREELEPVNVKHCSTHSQDLESSQWQETQETLVLDTSNLRVSIRQSPTFLARWPRVTNSGELRTSNKLGGQV